MAHLLADRVKETTTTTGTGNITLAGAVTGFRAFSAVLANNDTTLYAIVHQTAAEWEVGIGTWQTGGTLVRTTLIASSTGSAVNFSAGTKDVFISDLATPILNPLQFTTTTPGVPSQGVNIFSRRRALRNLPAFVGPSGLDSMMQPFLGSNMVAVARPRGNATNVDGFGFTNTANGTATAANVATTDLRTSTKRVMYASAATANSACGWRNNTAQYYRGDAAGRGGFFLVLRFAVSLTQTNWRLFAGMTATTGGIAAATDITALLNLIGVGKNSAHSNYHVIHNDGSGTATAVDTGIAAGSTTTYYELRVFCPPNGTTVGVSLQDLGSGTIFEASITTDMPANTTLLTPQLHMSNGGTAAAVNVDLMGAYMEVDN